MILCFLFPQLYVLQYQSHLLCPVRFSFRTFCSAPVCLIFFAFSWFHSIPFLPALLNPTLSLYIPLCSASLGFVQFIPLYPSQYFSQPSRCCHVLHSFLCLTSKALRDIGYIYKKMKCFKPFKYIFIKNITNMFHYIELGHLLWANTACIYWL